MAPLACLHRTTAHMCGVVRLTYVKAECNVCNVAVRLEVRSTESSCSAVVQLGLTGCTNAVVSSLRAQALSPRYVAAVTRAFDTLSQCLRSTWWADHAVDVRQAGASSILTHVACDTCSLHTIISDALRNSKQSAIAPGSQHTSLLI